MTDEHHGKSAAAEAEFLRQLRSKQMRRFVGRLPAYALRDDAPQQFFELLADIDRAKTDRKARGFVGSMRRKLR